MKARKSLNMLIVVSRDMDVWRQYVCDSNIIDYSKEERRVWKNSVHTTRKIEAVIIISEKMIQ